MTKLSPSTRRRELRPALASLVQAALRLRLKLTADERKGIKGQRRIELEAKS